MNSPEDLDTKNIKGVFRARHLTDPPPMVDVEDNSSDPVFVYCPVDSSNYGVLQL